MFIKYNHNLIQSCLLIILDLTVIEKYFEALNILHASIQACSMGVGLEMTVKEMSIHATTKSSQAFKSLLVISVLIPKGKTRTHTCLIVLLPGMYAYFF